MMAGKDLVIRNGRALLPGGGLERTDIALRGGKIDELGPAHASGGEIDAGGGYVLPGLIDLHTHGIQRESAQGSLSEYARIEAQFGATTFFPTLFGPPAESAAHMQRHRRESDELRALPQVGGFRLESPYLAATGAGVSGDLAAISEDVTETLLLAGGGHVKIWDISPELPGAPEAVASLSGAGVICSIAHTRATIEQGRAVVEAGARLVTHFYDVFPTPVADSSGVYPVGLVDYLLVEDRVVCEIIGDGTHVPALLVEKAFRCKPPHGLVFVTDSNFGAGLAPGVYDSPGSWGPLRIDGPNNGARMINRGLELAGSALTPIDALRNVVRLFGRDLATASRICSLNQARLLGLNKGEIAPGRDADLIVLDEQFELLYTIVAGQVAYEK